LRDWIIAAGLSRRPTEMTTPEKVVMEMENCLTSIGARINNYAKTLLGNPMLLRKLRRHTKNLANQRSITWIEIQNRRDVLAWDDQQMNRRLGTNVLKSHDGIVLVNYIPLNFSFDYSAK
jgi:hypothetical protein